MRRSSTLVGGHRWRALGASILISLLVAVLQSVPLLLVGAATGIGGASAQPGSGIFTFVQVLTALLGAVAQSAFGWLTWIALTILYFELSVRKEAFDLGQRPWAPEPATVPASHANDR